MIRRCGTRLLAGLFLAASAMAQDSTPQQAGIQVMGDRDSALGLILAPWKEETRADLDRPPALQDPQPQALDPAGFLRASAYQETRRAYRVERLQRNR